jgi:hypothetical protein
MVQSSEVMEIKGSPVKLIGLLAIGVLLTALSAALAFGWIPSPLTAVAMPRARPPANATEPNRPVSWDRTA